MKNGDPVLRSRSQLHGYQERGACWIVEHEAAALFMDVGLGKTVTALTAIAELRKTNTVRHALVIGPPRVVATVWPAEAARWGHTRELTVLALTGSPEERKQLLATRLREADVVCVSFSLLPWLHRTVARKTWDMVIVDESSQIKNPSTKRWKACAFTAMTAKRRLILTGTPTPRGLADLWGQVSFADLGERFGRSHGAFLRRYFVPTDYGMEPRSGAGRQIMAKLKGLALAMQAKDYLKLPSLIENRIAVELPSSVWEIYGELADAFSAELTSGTVVDAANAGVMVGKLQQLAQGALFTGGGERWEALHTVKLDAVEELVSELSGEPAIIAYWYRHDLARLRERFPEARVLGASMSPRRLEGLIEAWNRGSVPILFLHPASAGHGLNLQAGGRHLVWAALPWSFELYHQTCARLHRQGQRRPVMVHRVVAANTVDERILEVLAHRRGGHEALVGALRADVAAVRERLHGTGVVGTVPTHRKSAQAPASVRTQAG